MRETVLGLVRAVAPRRAAVELTADTDLGFPGYGLTILEYLQLLDRVAELYGVGLPEGPWPRSVTAIAEQVSAARSRR